MPICNVVFDIGNVLIRWDPNGIVESAFGLKGDAATEKRYDLFAATDIWRALNRGELTIEAAEVAYVDHGHLSKDEARRFFEAIWASLDEITQTPPLLTQLAASGFRVFALTDNVREIVAVLEGRHEWWGLFEGVTVSADVGCLKPDPRIFAHLLETHGLEAEETVFLDDIDHNVHGARAAGMHGFVFTGAAQAERDLATLGIQLAVSP